MVKAKTLKILIITLLLSCPVFAQQKSWYSKNIYKSLPKAKGSKARVICPGNVRQEFPKHGFGVKLGDPFALTYKYYASEQLSFAADFGKTSSPLYTRYYRSKFEEYTNPDTLGQFQSVSYLGHRTPFDLFAEFKVLYSFDASAIATGLQVYIGPGWQLRNTTIEYEYLNELSFVESQIRRLNVNRPTNGPSATIGIEYAYPEMPLSAFMEMQIYYDAVIDPGWFRPLGGVGIRFIF